MIGIIWDFLQSFVLNLWWLRGYFRYWKIFRRSIGCWEIWWHILYVKLCYDGKTTLLVFVNLVPTRNATIWGQKHGNNGIVIPSMKGSSVGWCGFNIAANADWRLSIVVLLIDKDQGCHHCPSKFHGLCIKNWWEMTYYVSVSFTNILVLIAVVEVSCLKFAKNPYYFGMGLCPNLAKPAR